MSKEITPEELRNKIKNKEKIILLDVREPYEFNDEHIESAVNYPISRLMYKIPEIQKDVEIITICAHGNRSEMARQIMVKKGFKALSLKGGMEEWHLTE